MMNILAWIILLVVYIFGIVPSIFGSSCPGYPRYMDSLVLGLVIHVALIAVAGAAFILSWALATAINSIGWL